MSDPTGLTSHNEIQFSFIPFVVPSEQVDNRFIKQDLFDVLSSYLESKDVTLVSIGSKLQSSTPFDPQLNALNTHEHHFDSDVVFDKSNRRKTVQFPYDIDNEKTHYIQYLPFFFQGELEDDAFDWQTCVALNKLSSPRRCLVHGENDNAWIMQDNAVVIKYILESLLDFDKHFDGDQTYILPFHPMDHFAQMHDDFEMVLGSYTDWLMRYRGATAILKAINKPYKIIAGQKEWLQIPPDSEELNAYWMSVPLQGLFKSVTNNVSSEVKEDSDTIITHTFNEMDEDDEFMTVVGWYKNNEHQGQEFFYHVEKVTKEDIKTELKLYANNKKTIINTSTSIDDVDIEQFNPFMTMLN